MNAKARSIFGSMGRGKSRRDTPLTPKKLGAVGAAIAGAIVLASFHQDEIASMVTASETVTVEFPRQYKVVWDSPYTSEVKIAGVIVGKVGEVDRTKPSTALVTLEVEPGTRAKLGSAPTAAIAAKLVVGGNYYVDLFPGGGGQFGGETIPPERTRLPVELEDVLGSISTPDAIKGVQSAVGQTTKTLQQGGRDALRDLVAHAPPTLRPAGVVLGSFRGTQPDTDLTTLVSGFESTASAFNLEQDRVKRIITGLDDTTAALAAGSKPLADSFATGRDTLRVTRAGLADLQPTLDELTITATEFRDSARELDPFLRKLNPALEDAEPAMEDLREVVEDARPLVHRLVPAVSEADDVLDDLQGPALDGLNGIVQKVLYSPYKGTDAFEGSGADRPMYKEIGYLMSDIGSVMANHDGNVALARLHASGGARTFGGQNNPMSLEQFMEAISKPQYKGPNENANTTGPLSKNAQTANKGLPGVNSKPAPKDLPKLNSESAPKLVPPIAGPKHDLGGALPLPTGGR